LLRIRVSQPHLSTWKPKTRRHSNWHCNSAADKSRAEQLARSVEGVKSVTNNLTARPPVPVIAQDDPLKTQVAANLGKYGITGIKVTVANGEVTLEGNLPRAKLQDAMKAANEAHPKKVNNKLNIK